MNPTWNFATPHVEGQVTRQAHANLPEGSFEREIGREGFFGAATHMYHRNPPTAWTEISGPIRPRALNPIAVLAPTATPWDALEMLHNDQVRIRMWRVSEAMNHLVRNADGDDLLFVHQGGGDLYCDYGHLKFEKGDYLVLPRGTMWRIEPSEPTDILMIESTRSSYRLPDRGLIGRHAPFDPGVLDRPAMDDAFRKQQGSGKWTIRVKRGGRIGEITYPYNPLDAIGWKGDLYAVRLNVRDIRSITSHQVHLPPSIRCTFASERFVVCTIVPRLVEIDPQAIKLPFYHNNDDYDEFIFYHSGRMSSRGTAFKAGMLTFHPSGFTHGPAPETLQHMYNHPAKIIESYSVMVDTLDPLEVSPLPAGCEWEGYAESWRDSIKLAPDADIATLAGLEK